MKTIKLILILILAINCPSIFAQTENDNEINEMLKKRAAEKVGQLNDYISYMANKGKSLEYRIFYRHNALNLFIGNGDAYEDSGQRKEGVFMETTSLFRKRPIRRLMKIYFSGLINLRYSSVVMKSTKINEIQVSELRKVDDNTFVCTACFEQEILCYRDGRLVYGDKTRKTVKVYIQKELTLDGVEYIVLLGDVRAVETNHI